MKRRIWIITAMALLLLAGMVSACTSSPAGTYVNQANSDEYLELNEDGSLYLKEWGVEANGSWEQEEDVLTFHFPELGYTSKGRLEDGKIIDNEGKVWVRGSKNFQGPDTMKDSLIGRRWQKVSEPELVLEFASDGTLYAVDPETGEKGTMGSYKFVDEDTIRMTAAGETAEADLRITGGSLFLSSQGDTEEYQDISSGGAATGTTPGGGPSMPESAGEWLVNVFFILAVLIAAGSMVRSLQRLR